MDYGFKYITTLLVDLDLYIRRFTGILIVCTRRSKSLLYTIGKNKDERDLIVNTLGHKWEYTFTTLVVFGGAFFASFPPILLNQFRRSLCRLDADPLLFCLASGIL